MDTILASKGSRNKEENFDLSSNMEMLATSDEMIYHSLVGRNVSKIEHVTVVSLRIPMPTGPISRSQGGLAWQNVLPVIHDNCVQEGLKAIRERAKTCQVKIFPKFTPEVVTAVFSCASSLIHVYEIEKNLALIGVEYALVVRDTLESLLKTDDFQIFGFQRKPRFSICVCSCGRHYHGIMGVSGSRQIVDFGEACDISSVLTQYCLLEEKLNISCKVVLDRETEECLPFRDFVRLPVSIVRFPQFQNRMVTVFLLRGRYVEGKTKFSDLLLKDLISIKDDDSTTSNSISSPTMINQTVPRRKSKMKVTDISIDENVFDLVDLLWDVVEDNRLEVLNELFDVIRRKSRGGDSDAEEMMINLVIIYSVCKKMMRTQQSLLEIFESSTKKWQKKLVTFSLQCVPIFATTRYKDPEESTLNEETEEEESDLLTKRFIM